MPRARISLPLAAALLTALFGCQRVRVGAQCMVRSSGSYCRFQNTGSRPGNGCFEVRVRARNGAEVHARTRACSGVLQPGQQSAPVALMFAANDPFERCDVEATTGALRDCVAEVLLERVEPVR